MIDDPFFIIDGSIDYTFNEDGTYSTDYMHFRKSLSQE